MEPEVAEAAAKAAVTSPGVWAAIVAAAFGAFGWLSNRLFRGVGHRIATVEQTASNLSAIVELKADKVRVESIAGHLAEAFQQQREDSQRNFDAIAALTGSFHAFETKVTEELGKRPTREEIKRK